MVAFPTGTTVQRGGAWGCRVCTWMTQGWGFLDRWAITRLTNAFSQSGAVPVTDARQPLYHLPRQLLCVACQLFQLYACRKALQIVSSKCPPLRLLIAPPDAAPYGAAIGREWWKVFLNGK
jgi:hypothetical protein